MTEGKVKKIPVDVALGLVEVPAEAPETAPEEAPAELRVVVNLDNLTIGDVEFFDRLTDAGTTEQLNFLDRCVEGDIRELPLPYLRDIMIGIQTAMDELSNPEVGGKN